MHVETYGNEPALGGRNRIVSEIRSLGKVR